MANYSEGLEFAYSALEDFEGLRAPEDESGANCHKLIMVFSDGGTEYPQEIISVYTNETRTITRQVNNKKLGTLQFFEQPKKCVFHKRTIKVCYCSS